MAFSRLAKTKALKVPVATLLIIMNMELRPSSGFGPSVKLTHSPYGKSWQIISSLPATVLATAYGD